jgi:hypothetical protein
MLKRYVKTVGSLAARWMLSLSLLDNAVEVEVEGTRFTKPYCRYLPEQFGDFRGFSDQMGGCRRSNLPETSFCSTNHVAIYVHVLRTPYTITRVIFQILGKYK